MKKIFHCLTLGFIVFLSTFFLYPRSSMAAYSDETLKSDDLRTNLIQLVSFIREKNPTHCPFRAYLVQTNTAKNCIKLSLFCEPYYAFTDANSVTFVFDCSRNEYESGLVGMHSCMTFEFYDGCGIEKSGFVTKLASYDSLVDKYLSDDSFNFTAGDPLNNYSKKLKLGMSFEDWSANYLIACNWSFKDKDGTVFFDRTPLAANWQKAVDKALQTELVEVRKNHPLPLGNLEQVIRGLMIVVFSVLSLIFLVKLLKGWHRSLIR